MVHHGWTLFGLWQHFIYLYSYIRDVDVGSIIGIEEYGKDKGWGRHLRYILSYFVFLLRNYCSLCNIFLKYSRLSYALQTTMYSQREAYINWSMVTCQGSTRSELP